MINPNAKYSTQTKQYDVTFEQYNNFDAVFGHFANNGKSYVVTRKDTPRQWLNFLVNDNYGCVVGNDGSYYKFHTTSNGCMTKYYSTTDYLIRTLNNKRKIVLIDENNNKIDLFNDCDNLEYTVNCGSVNYKGSINTLEFTITIFVPLQDECECVIINLKSNTDKKYLLSISEDYCINSLETNSCSNVDGSTVSIEYENYVYGVAKRYISFFSLDNSNSKVTQYSEIDAKNNSHFYALVTLEKEIYLTANNETNVYCLSGTTTLINKHVISQLLSKYRDSENYYLEKKKIDEYWDAVIEKNNCQIPDKNVEYFLNVWLKNQLNLTLRYNRNDIMGYRDVMQDAWGHLYVDSCRSKESFLQALSKMHSDGRCPRQYDRASEKLDDRDFMDSPIWAAIFLVDYIKETGDYSILDIELDYYEKDRKDSVLKHIILAFEHLYSNRGKNGLLLMRDGDWLDGLTGINKYGEATTVWGTIGVYYAQKLLIELFDVIDNKELKLRFEKINNEYKLAVNEVGWNGKWYTYAFIDDEPIGSWECKEGKIFLNAQSWAILSGIYDSDEKLEKMYIGISTYLSTMYGPLLMAPAYQVFGSKSGRMQNHKPGTFSNSAIYLHGASFKAAADCAVGRYNEAYDVFSRVLPSNPDTCDTRRTSEPYVVGNVYFGFEHPCFGLNLYTWFTATPAWMIHVGFTGLLGIKPTFNGLEIESRNYDGFDNYSVKRTYRNTVYNITFKKDKDKGIYLNGKKIKGNVVFSGEKICDVLVFF